MYSAQRRLAKYRGHFELEQTSWEDWIIEVFRPPYSHLEFVRSVDTLSRSEPGPGIVVVVSPRGPRPDPDRCCSEFDLLRWLLPWATLTVSPPPSGGGRGAEGILARLYRHGAVAIPATREPHLILDRVLSFDPKVDVRLYLRTVFPMWQAAARDDACTLFMSGFEFDREAFEGLDLPRRQSVWAQVGRALGVACRIQKNRSTAWTRVASESSYSSVSAANRALLRVFGVPGGKIHGTIGWEWLIWRFLRGKGMGKAKRWDL